MPKKKVVYRITQNANELLNGLNNILAKYKKSPYACGTDGHQLHGFYRFQATFDFLREQPELPAEAVFLIVYDLAMFSDANTHLSYLFRHYLEQTFNCPLLDVIRYRSRPQNIGPVWNQEMLKTLYMNLNKEIQLQLPKLKALGIVAGLEQYANHLCEHETSALVGEQLLATSKNISNLINTHEQLNKFSLLNIIQQERNSASDPIPSPSSFYLKTLSYVCSAIAYIFNCPINKLSSHAEVHHFFYNTQANRELNEVEYVSFHQAYRL